MWDLSFFIQTKFLTLQFFFYSDYQDFLLISLYYSPELILAFNEFFNSYWNSNVLYYTPSAVFDLFSDNLNSVIGEFLENIFLFFFLFDS